MKIRYRPGLAIMIVVCGAFILGTSLLTGFSINTVTGLIALVVGVGYLTRPLAELTESELTVLALFGPLKRRFSAAALRVSNGKIYEGDKKVPLAAWTVNGDDWRDLLQRIESRGP